MQIRELAISGSYEITPKQFADDRGVFLEWYRFDKLAEVVGHSIDLRQANASVSARGVVRGIHFADIPRGQAKYVTVASGAIIDYVVDVRIGSPTFGKWEGVLLDDVDRKAVYLGEGLGHAFVSLRDNTVVNYLVSDVYNPEREHGIDPLDPTIRLEFPAAAGTLILSPKDTDAPQLLAASALGLLPEFERVQDFYRQLDTTGY